MEHYFTLLTSVFIILRPIICEDLETNTAQLQFKTLHMGSEVRYFNPFNNSEVNDRLSKKQKLNKLLMRLRQHTNRDVFTYIEKLITELNASSLFEFAESTTDIVLGFRYKTRKNSDSDIILYDNEEPSQPSITYLPENLFTNFIETTTTERNILTSTEHVQSFVRTRNLTTSRWFRNDITRRRTEVVKNTTKSGNKKKTLAEPTGNSFTSTTPAGDLIKIIKIKGRWIHGWCHCNDFIRSNGNKITTMFYIILKIGVLNFIIK